MQPVKLLVAKSMLTGNSRDIVKFSLFILFILSACGPARLPATPSEIVVTRTVMPVTPTILSTTTPTVEATEASTSTPAEQTISPYYLPLVTKPDIESQMINGVTAQIDWAYADGSRVALQYTISGLDWPDGTEWDAMSVQVTSTKVPGIGFGGGGWINLPAKQGVIVGSSDLLLTDTALDANQYPTIDLRVDIPVKGPSPVGTFRFKFLVPVQKGIRMENIDQTVVAHDVSMTLKTFVLNPSRAEALICFQMPSAFDWGLTASTLTLGEKKYLLSGGGLLAGTEGKSFRLTDPDRCSTVGFDIAYDGSATAVTLTVPKLVASTPEVVDKERVTRANKKLAGTGIEFDYVNVDHGGNIVILKQPEGMTTDKIYPLIWDALADQYEGPWTFTVPIKR